MPAPGMGTLLLALMSLVTWLAAATLVSRETWRSRSEFLVELAVVWLAIILGPIYLLANLRQLTATTLTVALLTLCLPIIGVSFARRGPKAAAREHLHQMGRILRMPLDAVVALVRARSVVLVGFVLGAGVLLWIFITVLLSAPSGEWDGLWYHETIVGFTIQNKGFSVIDLPRNTQQVNGAPRSCNMVELYFAIYAGRWLVDIVNTPALIVGAAALFSLCRRFSDNEELSLGFVAVYLLMPANYRHAISTMVDPCFGSLMLIALAMVVRKTVDLRTALLSGVAIAVLVGAKYVAALPAGILSVALAIRLFAAPASWLARSLWIGLAATPVLAMMAQVYVRNFLLFPSPFWPYGVRKVPFTDVSFPSANGRMHVGGVQDRDWTFYWDLMTSLPWSRDTPNFNATHIEDYGLGVLWVVLPVGMGIAGVILLRWLLGRIPLFAWADPERRQRMGALAIVAITALPHLLLYPPITGGRYHIGGAAFLMICMASATGGPRRLEWMRGTLVAALTLSFAMTLWAKDKGWLVPFSNLKALAALPMDEREIDHRYGASLYRRVGLAREAEIGEGDVVAFHYLEFPSLLFNNDYSNRIVHLKRKDFLKRADEIGAKWVYGRGTDVGKAIDADPRWERIGKLEVRRGLNKGYVYRRVKPGQVKEAPPPDEDEAPSRGPVRRRSRGDR